MFTHVIRSISRINAEIYEINSVVGFPQCSNQSYLLPTNERNVLENFAARHGLSSIDKLIGMLFQSTLESFEDAMETLLFGRMIEINHQDDVLIKLVIPAIINHKEPDFRGLPINISADYIRYEFNNDNVKRTDRSHELDGTGWLAKLQDKISDPAVSIEIYDNPRERIKGIAFYFTFQDQTRVTHYAYIMSKNIIAIIDV